MLVLQYPLLSDLTKKMSRDFGVLVEDELDEHNGVTMRATFIIDPQVPLLPLPAFSLLTNRGGIEEVHHMALARLLPVDHPSNYTRYSRFAVWGVCLASSGHGHGHLCVSVPAAEMSCLRVSNGFV